MPLQFFKMRWQDYLLTKEGFANKRKYEQKMMRKAVALILQPYVPKGKSLKEYQIWPVEGDAEEIKAHSEQVSEKNLARLKAFKEKERLQKSKDN